MRIGIAGISGRMGRLLVEEVRKTPATLAGGIRRAGLTDGPAGVALFPDAGALAAASDVVVDFTHASTAAAHARRSCRRRAPPGCSAPPAFPPPTKRPWPARAAAIPVVYAANFAPGVNLLLALARQHGGGAAGASIRRRNRRDAPPPEGRRALRHRDRARPRRRARAAAWRSKTSCESGRDGHTGPARDRRHRLRRAARRPGGRRAHAAVRRGRRAHRAHPPRLRPPRLRHRRGARGDWVAGRPPGCTP